MSERILRHEDDVQRWGHTVCSSMVGLDKVKLSGEADEVLQNLVGSYTRERHRFGNYFPVEIKINKWGVRMTLEKVLVEKYIRDTTSSS